MFYQVINGRSLNQDGAMELDPMINAASGYVSISGDTTILAALNKFYSAFNRRDVEQSISNWAQQKNVVMCNPMGGIRRGIASIRDGYQSIMNGDTQVYVEFYDFELVETPELSYVTGRERGFAKRGKEQLQLDIRTSRIFQRIEGQWRQIHHHGSMTDTKALQRYQDFLKTSTEQ